ncbi:MAG: hypothetical protein ABSH20_13250 [Tepidisphaeraceae bacterium]
MNADGTGWPQDRAAGFIGELQCLSQRPLHGLGDGQPVRIEAKAMSAAVGRGDGWNPRSREKLAMDPDLAYLVSA